MQKAEITRCTGQDESYRVEFRLDEGYEAHGVGRRSSGFITGRLVNVYRDQHDSGARLFPHYADLSGGGALANLIHQIQPEEVRPL